MPEATVAALHVYPVKGCRGIALARARVAERGLQFEQGSAALGDREWMIVDAEGVFVSQRTCPRLALVEPRLVDATLVLAGPGVAPLAVPLDPARGPTREVSVWETLVPAHDQGADAARWLSDFLRTEVRLVRFDPAARRLCNPLYAGGSGAHTAFADGYPILVIGQGSLVDLDARLATRGAGPLPMNRFRPNVVLAGLEPYDEDHVDTVTAEGVTLRLVKPCTRCKVTTIDQATAEVGVEPLPLLSAYRHHPELGGATFGMNAIVAAGAGLELAVGTRATCAYRF